MSESDVPYPQSTVQKNNWNFFEYNADFYPIRTWPWGMQRLAMGETIDYTGRFTLWMFFVGNGVDPYIARDWVFHGKRDVKPDAREHVNNLIKNMKKMFETYKYWDMELQQSI